MSGMGTRAVLGFVAAAISVLTFHQAMWALLHVLNLPGLGMPPPYPTGPVPPWGVPRIIDLAFWGGLYGVVFGLALPRLPRPYWLDGLVLGVIAALVGLFVVAALKGAPIGGGWQVTSWVRSLLINGFWGIGVGLILPLILPRRVQYA
ncbi:MAG TPA: hypothetical protein VFE12_04330 [Acetobacteraceae bacterium]|nr:hypothetical protein [Acetobacteraceae bacterium]